MTALAGAVGRLPDPVGAWLGRRLGDLFFVMLPRRRRLAEHNIARAFPDMSPGARGRLCRDFHRHLGITVVEICRMLAQPLARIRADLAVEGMSHLRGALDQHGRALVLSAHLGNWELLTATPLGTEIPVATVVRPLDSPLLDGLVRRVREKTGIQLIDKRDALPRSLRALRAGGVLVILLDQNATRRESVFVPFFGELASTSRSMAVLALRTATPIVPIFIRRTGGGRHRIVVLPAVSVPRPNGRQAAVVELTMRCTRIVEDAIREAPEQWLWSHNRWRTRPPTPGAAPWSP